MTVKKIGEEGVNDVTEQFEGKEGIIRRPVIACQLKKKHLQNLWILSWDSGLSMNVIFLTHILLKVRNLPHVKNISPNIFFLKTISRK